MTLYLQTTSSRKWQRGAAEIAVHDIKRCQLLTNSEEHSSSWQAISFSASHEISRILWDLEIRYRIHNRPPTAPILSHINQMHASPFNP